MRARIEIKRVELWSVFKIAFLLYAAFGLIAGVFYGLFMVVAGGLQSAFLGDEFPPIGWIGGVFGLVLIPVVALFYGAIGSVMCTIGGAVFNLVSGTAGGIRFESEVDVPSAPASVTGPEESGAAPPASGNRD